MKATSIYHRCPRCDRVIRGPGFFKHVRSCKGKAQLPGKVAIQTYTISNEKLYASNGRMVTVLKQPAIQQPTPLEAYIATEGVASC